MAVRFCHGVRARGPKDGLLITNQELCWFESNRALQYQHSSMAEHRSPKPRIRVRILVLVPLQYPTVEIHVGYGLASGSGLAAPNGENGGSSPPETAKRPFCYGLGIRSFKPKNRVRVPDGRPSRYRLTAGRLILSQQIGVQFSVA